MAKPEWGTKRIGPCGTKFYDLNKSPIICPSCGGEVVDNKVKTKTNKNKEDKNFKSDSEEKGLSGDRSKDTVLDSGILDDEIINDDVILDDSVNSELEDNISDDEDINLIDDDNNIVLDVEIDEDEK